MEHRKCSKLEEIHSRSCFLLHFQICSNRDNLGFTHRMANKRGTFLQEWLQDVVTHLPVKVNAAGSCHCTTVYSPAPVCHFKVNVCFYIGVYKCGILNEIKMLFFQEWYGMKAQQQDRTKLTLIVSLALFNKKTAATWDKLYLMFSTN